MAENTKFLAHRGDDYATLTFPSGLELIMNYPDDEDFFELDQLVRGLNTILEGVRGCS